MKKYGSFLLYLGMWLLWAAWSALLVPRLPAGTATALIDSLLAKALVWVVPFLLLWRRIGPGMFFRQPFPWLPCLVILCCVTIFLHTLRLLSGLQNTYVFFDPMFIVFSVSAGVFEEASFRGGFFVWQEKKFGFWPAALFNGVMFTLYHYPELLTGLPLNALLSWRTLLIFGMGIVFCLMFRKWRNLAMNMAVHTVWDVLSYLFCLMG